MFAKYLLIFFVSMVPLVELRGSIVMAVGMDLDYWKVLHWGADKKYIGKFFSYCLEKGEAAGHRLMKKAGRGGLFVALMLFVGIPIPGTGAWTGTLAASFLDMGIKTTALSVSLGVIIAGIIMGAASMAGVHVFGL